MHHFLTFVVFNLSQGKGALQKLTAADRKKARLTALKDLFQVTDEDVKWEGAYDETFEHGDDPDWQPTGG